MKLYFTTAKYQRRVGKYHIYPACLHFPIATKEVEHNTLQLLQTEVCRTCRGMYERRKGRLSFLGLKVIVVFLFLCGTVQAQWHWYAPSNSTAQCDLQNSVVRCDLLADVLSHCTAEQRKQVYDADKETYCHEATHQVNANARNKFPVRYNCFYIGSHIVGALPEPNIKLSQVAAFVSAEHRDSMVYKTYFVDARQWWENEPLYVLDEFSAYVNDAQTSYELKNTSVLQKPLWSFCHYADCLVLAVKRHDPHYSHLKELETVITFQKQRVEKYANKRRR